MRFALALPLGLVIAACSAPSSTKSDIIVCEAGQNGCPGKEEPKPTKRGSTDPSDDDTVAPPSDPSPSADAGGDATKDAGPPSLGTLCTKLETCCDDLEKQGYSRATCQGVVDTRNETACHAQHEQYRKFGDCS